MAAQTSRGVAADLRLLVVFLEIRKHSHLCLVF